MPSKADVRTEAARLQATFVAAGALAVETDVLQPADILLDLYGEDIRSRAFVTHDTLQGEAMLRPDFTVPVVQMHMADGAEPARYTYSGEVFRRQEDGQGRASEYLQVGYEVFDRSDPAAADAEVFALIQDALKPLAVKAVTGDIGILMAAVEGLSTTERRKAALQRHIWRPKRFRALLDRFGGRSEMPLSRQVLLADADPMLMIETLVGLRSREEIGERISALHHDANEPPISAGEVDLLDQLLDVRGTSTKSLNVLRDIAVEMPTISNALSRMARRLEALDQRGIDVGELDFEASYGRTSMEYYDGFVFGFSSIEQPDLPPVATGGRYDALTRVLGQGKSIPAVGAVLRPELMLQLREVQS